VSGCSLLLYRSRTPLALLTADFQCCYYCSHVAVPAGHRLSPRHRRPFRRLSTATATATDTIDITVEDVAFDIAATTVITIATDAAAATTDVEDSRSGVCMWYVMVSIG
jgi:hypothetical protein